MYLCHQSFNNHKPSTINQNMIIKKYAAIDIGSNAMRLLVTNIVEQDGNPPQFNKSALVRVPIRLGQDAFTVGEISEENINRMIDAMKAFKLLMKVHQVEQYAGCATSALREAYNGQEVCDIIKQKADIRIEIIDGKKEAAIIASTDFDHLLKNDKNYLFVDVGGGSTEINIYEDGKNTASKSFKIGAVRILMKEDVSQVKKDLHDWLLANTPKSKNSIRSLGTGGSIGKIYEMANNPIDQPITFYKISELKELIERHSIEDRINILKLSPDRADVIVPAVEIYMEVMKTVGATTMTVPKVGLSDGMFEVMFQEKILSSI